ncbi:hypothetical protein NL676_030074, partial [Syzygium grande]
MASSVLAMTGEGQPRHRENAFLNTVVKPIYEIVGAEVKASENGTAPHCAWRNYDDINEYFWSKRCFEKLKWPSDQWEEQSHGEDGFRGAEVVLEP